MRPLMLAVGILAVGSASADEWRFGDASPVSTTAPAGTSQGMSSTGRQHLAVSATHVCVVWDDSRNGRPQAYVACRPLAGDRYDAETRLSTGAEGFDPVVVALPDGRFLFGWEQESRVWLRLGRAGVLEAPVPVGSGESGQISLAVSSDGKITVAFARRSAGYSRVFTVPALLAGDTLRVGTPVPVDNSPGQGDQLRPVAMRTREGTSVIWEDRRHGHTVLLHAHAANEGPYASARLLNEPSKKSDRYGRGSGVTGAAVACMDEKRLVATWMDRRNFNTGYDVYVAFSTDGGRTFGKNARVDDDFGAEFAQWHPAVAAGSDGSVIVVWDDSRDETQNLWFSVNNGDGWGANLRVSEASGAHHQSSPAVAMDAKGTLHLAWVERDNAQAPGRILYAVGRAPARQK